MQHLGSHEELGTRPRPAQYRERTGCEMPADVKATVLHKAMDDNTAQFARMSGKVSMDSYTDLKS